MTVRGKEGLILTRVTCVVCRLKCLNSVRVVEDALRVPLLLESLEPERVRRAVVLEVGLVGGEKRAARKCHQCVLRKMRAETYST